MFLNQEDHCSEGSVSSCQQISNSGVAVQGQFSLEAQVVSPPVLGESIGQVGSITASDNRNGSGSEMPVIFTREPQLQKNDVSSALRSDIGVSSSNNHPGIGDPLSANEVNDIQY